MTASHPASPACTAVRHTALTLVLLAGSLIMPCLAGAAPLSPGDILVVAVDPPLPPFSSMLFEFTRTGAVVQSFDIPDAGDLFARDAAVDGSGRVEVHEGRSQPVLDMLDPSTGQWSSRTIAGWGGNDNYNYGAVAVAGASVIATDEQNVGESGATSGLVRFPLPTGPGDRPVTNASYIDVAVGLDGLVYALDSQGAVDGVAIDVYDPVSFALLKRITLPAGLSARAIAVDGSGRVFVGSWQAALYRLSPAGVVEASATTFSLGLGSQSLIDVDVDGQGTVAAGASRGAAFVTNSAFDPAATRLLYRGNGYPTYVATTPGAAVPVIRSTWGAVKALYR